MEYLMDSVVLPFEKKAPQYATACRKRSLKEAQEVEEAFSSSEQLLPHKSRQGTG